MSRVAREKGGVEKGGVEEGKWWWKYFVFGEGNVVILRGRVNEDFKV